MPLGTATFNAQTQKWTIEAQPHVVLKAKRVFGKLSSRSQKSLELSDTIETARDLQWFCERYPLEVQPSGYLEERARAHRDRESLVEAMLSRRLQAPHFDLALPPREYQRIAAGLLLASGGLLLADDVGLGKAQPDDAQVLTPDGWRRIDSLAIGDRVIDPDGGHGTVTGVFPQGERDVFRLTTADGASTECCEEHLWAVYSANDRARGAGPRVLPLRDFMGDMKRAHSKPSWSISKWFLPVMQPATLAPTGSLPLDAYLLGALIGDGNVCGLTVRFSSQDDEILDHVRAALPPDTVLRFAGGVDWRISRVSLKTPTNPVLSALRALGLHGKTATAKSIPAQYLTASVDDRIALLQGLMDTDGDCSKEGTSIFSTSSPALRDDVVQLVRSLGGIASVSTAAAPTYTHLGEKRTGAPAYRVNLRVSFCPFRLARKASRWRAPIMARAVDSVVFSRRVSTRCIAVSTVRHLYVTDGHIVTHNTASAICTFADARTLPALVVTLTHLPRQWEAEIARFAPKLRTHVVRKGTPYDIANFGSRGRQLGLPGAFPDVVIINYHKLAGWAETLAPLMRSVVFDECQELRSGFGGRDTPAKYSAARHIAEHCDYRLGLSATPIYNYGGEFFSVLDILQPGALGTYEEFCTEWCDSAWDKPRIKDPKAFGTHARTSGIMLRRTRQEVGRELPGVQKVSHHVDADASVLNEAESACAELARIILKQGESHRGEKMHASEELSNRLRQATGIAKAPFVAEFVRLLVESGEKVVLFGWHREVYSIWLERLKDLRPVLYTGSESPTQKEASRDAFVNGDAKVFIMSLRSGAGLDGLQKCSRTVVFGELDWSPGVHEQCTGRVGRDGQEHPVVAYFLVADEGSDPIVADVLGVKTAQIEGSRDPQASLVETLEVDPDRIRRLATSYLARRAGKEAA